MINQLKRLSRYVMTTMVSEECDDSNFMFCPLFVDGTVVNIQQQFLNKNMLCMQINLVDEDEIALLTKKD